MHSLSQRVSTMHHLSAITVLELLLKRSLSNSALGGNGVLPPLAASSCLDQQYCSHQYSRTLLLDISLRGLAPAWPGRGYHTSLSCGEPDTKAKIEKAVDTLKEKKKKSEQVSNHKEHTPAILYILFLTFKSGADPRGGTGVTFHPPFILMIFIRQCGENHAIVIRPIWPDQKTETHILCGH